MKVLVVGTGLIGTSVGLALGEAADVLLSDPSADHLTTALDRGAGRRWDGDEVADLALVCAPPRATARIIATLVARGVASTVSHVSSHQSGVQAEVEAMLSRSERRSICGGHPMAGRERSGPSAATARLFLDRPWVVCPGPDTSEAAARAVEALATACGAVTVRARADQHDAAVALMSHVPQVAASAVAALLLEGPADFDAVRLAGPGVQDVTRLAGSDPELWVDVLSRNAEHVAPLLHRLAEQVHQVADGLAGGTGNERPPQPDLEPLRGLLERGRTGRDRLPFTAGRSGAASSVAVTVSDRPGQLAAVLTAAAEAGLNVEDVRVEHLPGRPRGLVELLVPGPEVERARTTLRRAGWEVLDPG